MHLLFTITLCYSTPYDTYNTRNWMSCEYCSVQIGLWYAGWCVNVSRVTSQISWPVSHKLISCGPNVWPPARPQLLLIATLKMCSLLRWRFSTIVVLSIRRHVNNAFVLDSLNAFIRSPFKPEPMNTGQTQL